MKWGKNLDPGTSQVEKHWLKKQVNKNEKSVECERVECSSRNQKTT